jgi:hypothetical protein
VHCVRPNCANADNNVQLDTRAGTYLCRFHRSALTRQLKSETPVVAQEPAPAQPELAEPPPQPITPPAPDLAAPVEDPHVPGVPHTPAPQHGRSLADLQETNRRLSYAPTTAGRGPQPGNVPGVRIETPGGSPLGSVLTDGVPVPEA